MAHVGIICCTEQAADMAVSDLVVYFFCLRSLGRDNQAHDNEAPVA